MLLVDSSVDYGRRGSFCHMVSDVSFAELHAFAAAIGVKRCWFHKEHYDLRPAARAAAVAAGAVEVPASELARRMFGVRGNRIRSRK